MTADAVGLRGARVVVLGLARSGVAAARALLEEGARVRALDAVDTPRVRAHADALQGSEVVLGRLEPADIGDADLIVTSPGVAPWSPWLVAARAGGVRVWSEIELAWRLGVHPVVAVTGTNGKTTTTEMTAACLRASGMDAVAAGNIGTTTLVDLRGRHVAIVAEVSSFQLEHIDAFHAPVAVALNLAQDHLDWHGSMASYARAKSRLFADQTAADVAIVHDDPACRALVAGTTAEVVPFDERSLPPGGAGVVGGWIEVPQGRVVALERLSINTRPMIADAVAAAAAACAAGADPLRAGEALAAYRPGPHRVQTIAQIDGVTFVDDSKATDPHATLAALEDRANVVLIAGGRNKGNDLSELTAAAAALEAVVAIGEAADEIVRAFEATPVPVERAGSMEDAVLIAHERVKPGGTVLLSPACASFDMFENYEARGAAFRDAVERRRGGNR